VSFLSLVRFLRVFSGFKVDFVPFQFSTFWQKTNSGSTNKEQSVSPGSGGKFISEALKIFLPAAKFLIKLLAHKFPTERIL
jgi:hypothetical protein